MATNFPTSLDSLVNPSSNTAMNSSTAPHAAQHANANDAIEALEAKVGVNNSTVTTSIDYFMKKAVQRKEVATGTVAASGTAQVNITWATPFPSTNYVVVASIVDFDNRLRLNSISNKTVSQIAVELVNSNALNSASGTVQAIGIAI